MPRKSKGRGKAAAAAAAGDELQASVHVTPGAGSGAEIVREPAAAAAAGHGQGGQPAMAVARGGGGGGRGVALPHPSAPAAVRPPGPEFFPPPGAAAAPVPAAGRAKGPYVPAATAQFAPPSRAAAPAAAPTDVFPPPAPAPGAPSAAPPAAAAVDSLNAQVAELQLAAPAPASAKALRFPDRPSLGRLGKTFQVRTNHFRMDVVASQGIVLYRVEITPTVMSRGLNRAVVRQLVEQAPHELGNKLPVFDGRNSLYTAGVLPFDHKTFRLSLPDEQQQQQQQPPPQEQQHRPRAKPGGGGGGDGGPPAPRERVFTISIKYANRVELDHLRRYMGRQQADMPQDVLNALDIVLRELPSRYLTPIGRCFYSPHFGERRVGEGVLGWRGFFQSVRPTQGGLSLNLNISATAILEPVCVVDFLAENLRGRRMNPDFGRGLAPEQKKAAVRALRGVKVEVTHRGQLRRKYRISGVTEQATRDLSFEANGVTTDVVSYFRATYNYAIKFPMLPCLNVGANTSKPSYLPMEVCKILPGQRYPARQLVDNTRTGLLQMTSQRPSDRESEILRVVKENNYGGDMFAREFGITVCEKNTTVTARLLDPPSLMYKGTKGEGLEPMQVSKGTWNMFSKRFITGATVKTWACVNFNHKVPPNVARNFCHALSNKCSSLGMSFNPQPVLDVTNLSQVAADLKKFLSRCPGGGSDLGLLIAIFPDFKTDWYGELKRVCETEVGIISQVCWSKHVFKGDDQYLANVAMKINVKCGGRNTVLREAIAQNLPTLGKVATIIFGADVTHPSPGEDDVPSIAAVVASQDWPQVTTYAGQVSAQAGRVEMIFNLQQMVVNLLRSFYVGTGLKPGRILFYRDGVSEGQFHEVLNSELRAIQMACRTLDANYSPAVTFVVVQKRHHTRFFPVNPRDFGDRNGNVLAGTVVDTQICHPREFDFYLCSHAGLLGTSKPAHYHVLYDDNKFTADSLQTLTNSLCSTYQRCTRSVSIVPPAYYAHHLATRARVHMGQRTGAPAPVHQRIKSAMYYC